MALIPIEEAVDKDWLLKQIRYMMTTKRMTLSMSADKDSSAGIMYDAGYMACLTEIQEILLNPGSAVSVNELEELQFGKKMTDTDKKDIDEEEY
jgi:hypothetical protein